MVDNTGFFEGSVEDTAVVDYTGFFEVSVKMVDYKCTLEYIAELAVEDTAVVDHYYTLKNIDELAVEDTAVVEIVVEEYYTL